MYQYKGLEDTIAAIATAAGQGAIGIVRISGRRAIAMSDDILRLSSGKKLAECKTHTVHHGWAGAIDEVLVTLMRAPRSYTTEDVVEINCHGGPVALRAVFKAVLAAGARCADPGEFTKRAFLGGRLDLSQAEAVMDLIGAQTENFLRVAENQLKGQLSQTLKAIREELMESYTSLEAVINFPEDAPDTHSHQRVLESINRQAKSIDKLLRSADCGRILKEGIRIVLCGRPNVGKSSLLNGLLKTQRAIVTDIAGTTRDVLEESMHLKGFLIHLVDTAGILEPQDLIEQEAVKRSRLYMDSADLVLLVLDGSALLQEADMMLMEKLKNRNVLAVVNKTDLTWVMDRHKPTAIFGENRLIDICALSKASIEALEEKIIDIIEYARDVDTHGVVLSNLRHIKALESALGNLKSARSLMRDKVSLEFVSEEIRQAIHQLDAITGRHIDEDLLDRIFSRFCIGK